ncbi:hypothetical protein [Bosea sp. (in: a-proteobacteria)]|uniref:hypothetical protein n=1 Tax=Bosea sp. (in: a-proteobacteria) TaxID=1871050 RepID=UPI0026220979|nr:hypothetical protein [Bosea sp. (in: a-proteobacteria)]MCO5092677.1 hypothetical protein [Bosea sp. (in: a-proteobacteria)]
MNLGSFPRQPNAADFVGHVDVIDDRTNTPWDLTTVRIEMEVVDQRGCRRLYGSTDDGKLTLAGDGFDFRFPASEMRNICAGSYTVNILATDTLTGFVQEPVIADLPVIEGGYR